MTLRKRLCKPKDRVATEDKNNIVFEIDCSNCQAVYFGESKRSLKSRSAGLSMNILRAGDKSPMQRDFLDFLTSFFIARPILFGRAV